MDLKNYVADILSDIRAEGRKAVEKYSREFDDYNGPLKFEVGDLTGGKEIPEKDRKTIRDITERVRNVHERQYPEDDLFFQEGSIYGRIYRSIEKVGLYVPGGRPLPSSLIMSGVPARIAGVGELVLATPPDDKGEIDPYVLYTAHLLGIKEVCIVGGAQAVGALAYGAGVPSVDKICGPGNRYVNEAKRQVYGEVGIDGLAGPSEVCVVADETADREEVLADLQSQLEHGEDSRAWLFTTSEELADYCERESIEVEVQPDLEDCVERANDVAPEHLEIKTDAPAEMLKFVRNAGAVYLGRFTPSAAADYFLGTNHVLPTGGAARFDSVLTVRDFLKPISFGWTGEEEFRSHSQLGERMAEIEGMTDHKKSLEVRKNEEDD
ncbi:histidinol dehydrogenase [Candidatus Bipolaricaulota bacterium]|nr:histidinol dehydrogenase [Candidatus Bipolaricaulota bacterium]